MAGAHLFRDDEPPMATKRWRWKIDDQWYGIEDAADALWLAHLIGVCGKRGWDISLTPLVDGWTGAMVVGFSFSAKSNIEALAHAMLAVPDKPA